MSKKINLRGIKGSGDFSLNVSFFDSSPPHTVKKEKFAMLSKDCWRSHSGLSENRWMHLQNRCRTRGMMTGAPKYACFGAKYDSNHSNVPPTAPMSILNFDSASLKRPVSGCSMGRLAADSFDPILLRSRLAPAARRPRRSSCTWRPFVCGYNGPLPADVQAAPPAWVAPVARYSPRLASKDGSGGWRRTVETALLGPVGFRINDLELGFMQST